MKREETTESFFRKTRSVLLSINMLNEPFVVLYALLPFILRKDLNASAFQISLLTMLKPMVAVFSFYWSARLAAYKDKLRTNLVIAGLLSFFPFLFFIFTDSIWYLLLSAAVYMLFSRAGIPAWVEVLKRNLVKTSREKLFSLGLAIGCAEGVLLGSFIGSLLDSTAFAWKALFFGSALLGMLGVFLQSRLPIRDAEKVNFSTPTSSPLTLPWKTTWHLLKTHPQFCHWQWGTMANGFGIMLTIPAQALFFADVLSLSHKELSIGRCICFGLGFVLSSTFWSRSMGKVEIHRLTSIVCFGFALFPLFLLLSSMHLFWMYSAFVLYGITQAGSNLIWNLSGTHFAGNEDSSQFTGVNVLMVGIRGCIAPLLGGLLCELIGPWFVLALGMLLSYYGSWYLYSKKPFALVPKTK